MLQVGRCAVGSEEVGVGQGQVGVEHGEVRQGACPHGMLAQGAAHVVLVSQELESHICSS